MSAQIADFNVRFNADSATFKEDINDIRKSLYRAKTAFEAANDSASSFSYGMKKGLGGIKALGGGLASIAGVAGAAVAGLGVAAGATAVLVKKQADLAREVERMATVSDVSVERIQALGYASEQYGVSGDRMADMLKDVNDKLGDFAATAGGEFKDFMTNLAPTVGLTVEKLQKLSSSDALIAIKDAMDATNVPMKQQIFYLESIANNASALMPLLSDNGRELKRLTKHYDDLNVSMSDMDIQQLKEMDQAISDAAKRLERSFQIATLGANDYIIWLANQTSMILGKIGAEFDALSDNPRTMEGVKNKLKDLEAEARGVTTSLSKAKMELSELQSKAEKAKGNLAEEAHLANSGLYKDITKTKENVKSLKSKLNEIDGRIKKLKEKKNDNNDGNKGESQPKLRTGIHLDTPEQQSGKSTLSSLDAQYGTELDRLRMAHEERLAEIENLQLSEQEIKRRGYESLEELKRDYVAREQEFATEQEEAYFQKLDENMQRELNAYARKAEEKRRIDAIEARQLANDRKQFDNQMLGMQMGLAQQSVGVIEATAEEGSAAQKAAMVAQKAITAAQIFINTEEAASKAIALYPGPTGETKAMQIRIMGGISMAMVAAQTIAGMAHSGISEVPAEGTWLLDKGERVYTNDSARRLDKMYGVIMSHNASPYPRNNPIMQHARALQAQHKSAGIGGMPVTVVINEAPAGSHVESIDDEKKIINVMMKDAHSSGQYMSYIGQKLGVKAGGYK